MKIKTHHPRLASNVHLLAPRIRRHGNDGHVSHDPPVPLQIADPPRRSQPVHHRHLEIHQYERQLHLLASRQGRRSQRANALQRRRRQRVVPQLGLAQEVERFAAVVGDVHDAACGAQLFGQHFLVDEVVFHEQDMVVCAQLKRVGRRY